MRAVSGEKEMLDLYSTHVRAYVPENVHSTRCTVRATGSHPA